MFWKDVNSVSQHQNVILTNEFVEVLLIDHFLLDQLVLTAIFNQLKLPTQPIYFVDNIKKWGEDLLNDLEFISKDETPFFKTKDILNRADLIHLYLIQQLWKSSLNVQLFSDNYSKMRLHFYASQKLPSTIEIFDILELKSWIKPLKKTDIEYTLDRFLVLMSTNFIEKLDSALTLLKIKHALTFDKSIILDSFNPKNIELNINSLRQQLL